MRDNKKQLEIKYVPLSDAVDWELKGNAKLHDMGAMIESIKRYGFRDPPEFDPSAINVKGGKGAIPAGNGRMLALVAMKENGDESPKHIAVDENGEWVVPVVFGADSESREAALAYSFDHNNLTMSGGHFDHFEMAKMWDEESYAEILKELQDIDMPPVSMEHEDIDSYLRSVESNGELEEPEAQTDKAEELREKWGVERGQLWQLGEHRLICGDCRESDIIDKLLQNDKVDQLLTDPPYGVNYSKKNEFLNSWNKGNCVQTPIENDLIEDYRQFFSEFISIIPFAAYNTIYVFMLGQELHNLRLAIDNCECTWGDYLVWKKNNHVLGLKDYNAKHEFIVYGWKGKHKFYGKNTTTIILEFNKLLRSEWHPTMKPIELVEKIMTDGTLKGMIVYDPFLGSGTTLLACEQLKCKCRAIEISPAYCAVTLQRWVDLTNEEPKIVNN